ncbi:MAG: hypothetical protein ING82_16930 [Roseomonas sp.]|nr:hypothetical protein [Roseomonas sp.]
MVYDIYSKRVTRRSEDGGDVYQYASFPYHVRVQLVLLWERFISKDEKKFALICQKLREEYGCFSLLNLISLPQVSLSKTTPFLDEVKFFFIHTRDVDQCLDVVEECAKAFCNTTKVESYGSQLGEWGENIAAQVKKEKIEFVKILNARLREAQIGYQFENGQIIRIDNQFIHADVVKPALSFISTNGFEGANHEFLEAHEKYREGDYTGSLIESAKAFESVLKIVLRKHGQDDTAKDTASALLNKFFALNLLPSYLQKQFNDLKSLLQGGTPNVRNKEAAHGQGEEIREVPEYLAAYGLHQTASAILLIVKAHEAAR